MRVILHIGPQKTGSSYLQKRLFHYRIRLKRHNFEYHLPPDGQNRHAPQRPALQGSDVGPLIASGNIASFAEEVTRVRDGGAACMIVSSEFLSKLKPADIAALGAVFAGDEVEVFAYVRRWSERLPSAWWQQVATGLSTPFPEWLAATLANATRNWLVNEALLWQRWADVFGRQAIHVLSYDALRAGGADLADDFLYERLGFTGMLMKPAVHRPEINTKPPPLEVEIIRNLHEIAAARGGKLSQRGKRLLLDELRAGDFAPFRALSGDAVESLVIDDSGPAFAAARTAMEAWSDRLATRDLTPEVVQPRSAAFRFVPAGALGGAEARAAFGRLVEKEGVLS